MPNATGNDVVARAKAKGFKISLAYVYSCRSKAKANAGQPPKRRGRPPKDASAPLRIVSLNTSQLDNEGKFRALVIELGRARANELVASAFNGF